MIRSRAVRGALRPSAPCVRSPLSRAWGKRSARIGSFAKWHCRDRSARGQSTAPDGVLGGGARLRAPRGAERERRLLYASRFLLRLHTPRYRRAWRTKLPGCRASDWVRLVKAAHRIRAAAYYCVPKSTAGSRRLPVRRLNTFIPISSPVLVSTNPAMRVC